MCPGKKLWCSVQRRCGVCGVCHGPVPPCQWEQMDVCCSRVVRRHVRMRISWDALGIDGGEEVVIRLVGEVDTKGGLAWTGRNR